jgi:hypothetical protein
MNPSASRARSRAGSPSGSGGESQTADQQPELGQVTREPVAPHPRRLAQQPAEGLHERRVRTVAADRVAPPGEGAEPGGLGDPEHLVGQPGLADARQAGEHERPGVAPGDTGDEGAQPADFRSAADQRRASTCPRASPRRCPHPAPR